MVQKCLLAKCLRLIDFDKRRTRSQLQNKFVYAWEGAKQLFLRNPKVNDVLDEMSQYMPDEEETGQVKPDNEALDKEEVLNKEEILGPIREESPEQEEVHEVHTPNEAQRRVREEINKEAREEEGPTKEEKQQKEEEIILVEEHPVTDGGVKAHDSEGMIEEGFKLYPSSRLQEKAEGSSKVSVIQGNHGVFLCLNIPSYMGGASDPWATSKGIYIMVIHLKINR